MRKKLSSDSSLASMVDMMFGGLGIAAAFFLAFDLARANARIVHPEVKVTTIRFETKGESENRIQVIPLNRQSDGFLIDESTYSQSVVSCDDFQPNSLILPGGPAHIFESREPISRTTYFLVFASQSSAEQSLAVDVHSTDTNNKTDYLSVKLHRSNGWWTVVSLDCSSKLSEVPTLGSLASKPRKKQQPQRIADSLDDNSIKAKELHNGFSYNLQIVASACHRFTLFEPPIVLVGNREFRGAVQQKDVIGCFYGPYEAVVKLKDLTTNKLLLKGPIQWITLYSSQGYPVVLPNAHPCQGFCVSPPHISFIAYQPRVEEALRRILQANDFRTRSQLFRETNYSSCDDQQRTYFIGSAAIASLDSSFCASNSQDNFAAIFVKGGDEAWNNKGVSIEINKKQVQRMNELHAFLQKESFDAGDPYAFCLDVLTMSNDELKEKELLFHPKMWTKTNSTSAP